MGSIIHGKRKKKGSYKLGFMGSKEGNRAYKIELNVTGTGGNGWEGGGGKWKKWEGKSKRHRKKYR